MERDAGLIKHKVLTSFGVVFALGAGAVAYGVHVLHDKRDLGPLPRESPEGFIGQDSFACFREQPNCDDTTGYLAKLSIGGNRILKPLAQIDDDLENAVVDLEDQRFREHDGIDDPSIARALLTNGWASIRAGSITFKQGASTIEMQLARNLFLADKPADEWDRKMWEAEQALKLDRDYTKDEILEKYLNVVNWGRGAYSAETAAQAYFGKSANDLTFVEAATLAATLQSPDSFDGSIDPVKDSNQRAALADRRDIVVEDLYAQGHISKQDYDDFKSGVNPQKDINTYLLDYNVYPTGITADYSVADTIGARHFLSEILEEVKNLSGYTDEQLAQNLRINTTLSYFVQAQVNIAATEIVEPNDGRQIAVVAMNQDGAILGKRGGDFATEQTDLTESPQPGGSADKPYFDTEALIKGTADMDTKTYADSPTFSWIAGNSNGTDWVSTGGDHCSNHEACTMREAIAVSSNPVHLQIVQDMGPTGIQDTYNLMESLGSHSETPAVPASVLGARETSVMGRTTMMNSLVANQGVFVAPYDLVSVNAIENGQVVNKYTYTPPGQKAVVDPAIAALVTDALRGVPKNGTASRVLADLATVTDIAGKTGTDDGNKVANYYGSACITATDGSRYNLTLGIAERFPSSLEPLGSGHTGGNYPAKVFEKIISTVVGDFCSLNG